MSQNNQSKPNHQVALDVAFMERLLAEAKESPRLRVAYDLRTTPEDQSQRMLNAMLPGTQVPIHRHTTTTEVVTILYGRLTEIFFDEEGNETERFLMDVEGPVRGISIPLYQWHTVEVTEPCVILEAKDGPYEPAKPENLKV